MPKLPSFVEDRLLSKVVKDDETGCWEWQGATGMGYGQMRFGGHKSRIKGAHRVSYEWFMGPIPEGMDLDHLCRNTICVNPFHLDPVIRRENVWRGLRGGRDTCRNGHVYTAESRHFDKNGKQSCKICNRESQVRYRARKKVAKTTRTGV